MMLKKAHRMANRSLKILGLLFWFLSKNYHLLMFWKIMQVFKPKVDSDADKLVRKTST